MTSRMITLLCLCAGMSLAQDKPPVSVWSGVYATDQAARGEAGYRDNCASCHGAKLEGGAQNPPLAGTEFTTGWNGRMLDELFEKIQTSMPADRPGKLPATKNAEILAYILKANQIPAGQKELVPDTGALHNIRFDAAQPGK